jgi:hypothetical protein
MNTVESATLLGWYVRVTTNEFVQGEPATLLYLAGYADAGEAEEAVKQSRSVSGEKYQAVASAIAGRGPQPMPKEVRELKGAV